MVLSLAAAAVAALGVVVGSYLKLDLSARLFTITFLLVRPSAAQPALRCAAPRCAALRRAAPRCAALRRRAWLLAAASLWLGLAMGALVQRSLRRGPAAGQKHVW